MTDKQCAEQLYLQIKQDIRVQNFAVGEALKQVELSKRYGVSRIPIRDATRVSEGAVKTAGGLSSQVIALLRYSVKSVPEQLGFIRT